MSQSRIVDALAAGATVVTPNNRLARNLALRFDASRRARGDAAWASAQALPWALWLDRLWLGALASRANEGRLLLDAGGARELWYSVVKADRTALLNPRGAARHAMDAWTQFHAWRAPHESLQAAAVGGNGDDVATFAKWAQHYQRRLDALAAIDPVQLPDALTRAAAHIPPAAAPIILHGFLTMTPQQRRLVAALRGAGISIDEQASEDRVAACRQRTACPTPSVEIARALTFARERITRNPAARVAIVVANLHERRTDVIALAEEILCPERLLALQPDASRPYGVSLGEPLSATPIVACALDLVALACGHVDATVAAALLRTPFLPDAGAQWTRRAVVEREWRETGRRVVGWFDVVAAVRTIDPALHQRLSGASLPSRTARLPREWAQVWSDWLNALGWPTGHAAMGPPPRVASRAAADSSLTS